MRIEGKHVRKRAISVYTSSSRRLSHEPLAHTIAEKNLTFLA